MPLETATHITDLVITNPANSDGLNQADDHMRMIKSVLQTDIGNALVSKKLAVVDGTSGAPSIGFSADATAGLYRSGTGILGITGSLIGQGTVDIGFIGIWPTGTAPTGYLPCDGTAVSRTTYAALFAKIGTVWGAGDGSTTFNIPNLINRFPRHRDNGAVSGNVGNVQASQNQTHTHGVVGNTAGLNNAIDHLHTFSGTTGSMNRSNPHSHPGAFTSTGAAAQNAVNGPLPINWSATSTGATDINHEHAFSGTTSAADRSLDHTHGISITSGAGSADGAEARPLSATVLFVIRVS